MNLKHLIESHKTQDKVFVVISVIVFSITIVLCLSDCTFFQRFIGHLPPLLAMLISIVVGFAALSYLLRKGWFEIYEKGVAKYVFKYVGLAILLACISILIDWIVVFPQDINLGFPLSLLFYPAIAFVVEIFFHVLPLALILFLGNIFFKPENPARMILAGMIFSALLEPSFQAFFMEEMPVWAVAAVWGNLFLFNGLQLVVFRKYGFVSMYLLRLAFYLVWHVVWGYLRLDLLF